MPVCGGRCQTVPGFLSGEGASSLRGAVPLGALTLLLGAGGELGWPPPNPPQRGTPGIAARPGQKGQGTRGPPRAAQAEPGQFQPGAALLSGLGACVAAPRSLSGTCVCLSVCLCVSVCVCERSPVCCATHAAVFFLFLFLPPPPQVVFPQPVPAGWGCAAVSQPGVGPAEALGGWSSAEGKPGAPVSVPSSPKRSPGDFLRSLSGPSA